MSKLPNFLKFFFFYVYFQEIWVSVTLALILKFMDFKIQDFGHSGDQAVTTRQPLI